MGANFIKKAGVYPDKGGRLNPLDDIALNGKKRKKVKKYSIAGVGDEWRKKKVTKTSKNYFVPKAKWEPNKQESKPTKIKKKGVLVPGRIKRHKEVLQKIDAFKKEWKNAETKKERTKISDKIQREKKKMEKMSLIRK